MTRFQQRAALRRGFRKHLGAGLAVLMLFSAGPVAAAGSEAGIFRRSYFSHALPPEVQARFLRRRSRSADRPVGGGPGFAIRGVYRDNRTVLRSGLSTDVTISREDWFNISPQGLASP